MSKTKEELIKKLNSLDIILERVIRIGEISPDLKDDPEVSRLIDKIHKLSIKLGNL